MDYLTTVCVETHIRGTRRGTFGRVTPLPNCPRVEFITKPTCVNHLSLSRIPPTLAPTLYPLIIIYVTFKKRTMIRTTWAWVLSSPNDSCVIAWTGRVPCHAMYTICIVGGEQTKTKISIAWKFMFFIFFKKHTGLRLMCYCAVGLLVNGLIFIKPVSTIHLYKHYETSYQPPNFCLEKSLLRENENV